MEHVVVDPEVNFVYTRRKRRLLGLEDAFDPNTPNSSVPSDIMHQSIPAVPIPPPRATAGHLLTLSAPGVGHSQFYRGPGSWALAYPGATPGHLTCVFSN